MKARSESQVEEVTRECGLLSLVKQSKRPASAQELIKTKATYASQGSLLSLIGGNVWQRRTDEIGLYTWRPKRVNDIFRIVRGAESNRLMAVER